MNATSLSSRAAKRIGSEFGLTPAVVKKHAVENNLTGEDEVRASIRLLDQARSGGVEGESGQKFDGSDIEVVDNAMEAVEVVDEPEAQPIKATKKSKKVESPSEVPAWFTAILPAAQWKNWKNFLPDELPAMVGGPMPEPSVIVGIWKAGGKGMNVRKLVKTLKAMTAVVD